MKKILISKNSLELARDLNLEPYNALEWELRLSMNLRIIQAFHSKKVTISALAKKSKTSRARITRILKEDTQGISLEVLLRILSSLGQMIDIRYKKAA